MSEKNGILIVNKPTGITSHDVVSKVRKIFETKRVGHVGTLDPLASGVLVVLINDATKIAQFLENDSKTYTGTICFGIATDSFDIDGNVLIDEKCDISEKEIDECLKTFIGINEQKPPIYSAIKIDGKKLYEYARKDIEVEIPTRKVEIKRLERISPITKSDKYCYFDFMADVSKGTYIRSIINDISQKLSKPAVLTKLERTRSGLYNIENSHTLEEIGVGNYHLINLVDSLPFKKIDVSNDERLFRKIDNGMRLSINEFEEEIEYITFIKNDKMLAIYELRSDDHKYYAACRVWK